MEVDYLELSKQYASFLIAVGGVSITVLALVLSRGNKSNAFLVAALVVATISCFTGAHMMAETASFITYSKGNPSGQRLFLLASTNIFIAVVLVIFALMLLPIVLLDEEKAAEIKWISISVFGFVVISALGWMFLSVFRMPAPDRWLPITIPAFFSLLWGFILFCLTSEKRKKHLLNLSLKCKKHLLKLSFIPIIFFTFFSLLCFALTFNYGGEVSNEDILLFSSGITSTCASLVVAAWRQPEFSKIN